ncbi:prostate stem cell antigen-like [Nerophis ophidion]|uniref:prostate stem cell antigen-like n=1 Tax=Nerophis ophidion TaxID=159077 RepID=UPI002AE013C8|nr:prostate stem cell antigen-like [Nerophis ophidion]
MLLGLVFLCFVSPVLSLSCYVCTFSLTNDECNVNTQECQAPLDTCMTVIDTLGQTKAIVKQCASKATCNGAASTAFVDENGNGNAVNCCNTHNLCNFSGSESVHARRLAFVLLVPACALLLW